MQTPETAVNRFASSTEAVEHMVQASEQALRCIDIFSHSLAPELYCEGPLVAAISLLARRSAHSKVRILVKDTRPLHNVSHLMVNLARRLPSHVALKQIIEDTSKPDTAFFCVDEKHLVFFNNESEYIGFFRQEARAESKHFLEQFNNDWQRNSKTDVNLRILAL